MGIHEVEVVGGVRVVGTVGAADEVAVAAAVAVAVAVTVTVTVVEKEVAPASAASGDGDITDDLTDVAKAAKAS